MRGTAWCPRAERTLLGDAVPLFAVLVLAALTVWLWSRWRQARRAEFIRNFNFPPGLFERLARQHPQLEQKDRQLVAQGLRQFFLAYLLGGRRFVSMPSQVADDLWHEFILYTRNYARFCDRAFGRFLHHTPAVVLRAGQRDHNTGLRRAWWWCCRQEHLDPRHALRLPLLFALDRKLAIVGGFAYAVDCRALREPGGGTTHCGGDMGSSSFDGSTDGFGDSGGGDGDGGGGCGGGSCGGGD